MPNQMSIRELVEYVVSDYATHPYKEHPDVLQKYRLACGLKVTLDIVDQFVKDCAPSNAARLIAQELKDRVEAAMEALS